MVPIIGRTKNASWLLHIKTRLPQAISCLFILAAAVIGSGCPDKKVKLEKWPFESRAVKLHYIADEKLNYYDGQPHTLLMCVYQLSDPNAFNELRMDRGGIQELLECKRFDKSVASSDKLVVHPGDEETIVYDRAEDARFVGVVAGYYELWPNHVTRLVLVPVKIEVTGRFIRKKTAMPAKLNLGLYLGQAEIQQILE